MLETSFTLIVFLFPLTYSPGPGNLFFAANGARFGFWATVPANLGYHVATFAMTLLIGLGFARGAAQFPALFYLLKGAGAAYVAWLGWRIMRACTAGVAPVARVVGFADGGLLLLLNPKAYVIIAVMFSQFAQANLLLLAVVFTLNNMLAFVIWTRVGDMLGANFRNLAMAARLNAAMGAMLISVAIWMVSA